MMNFQGYSNDKPSSRVLNPPGGRSNNIFGYSEEPKQTNEALKNKTNRNQGSDIFGNGTAQVDNSCNKPVHPARQSSNIFGEEPNYQQKNQRRGYNTITGEAYPSESVKQTEVIVAKEDPKPVIGQSNVPEHVKASQEARNNLHTSSRVLQPPGGAQTRLW